MNPLPQTLVLYSRPECHLCDEAMILLDAAGLADCVTVVDIEPNLKLLSRYGDKVPVLCWSDGRELFWPFNLQNILDMHNARQPWGNV